MTTEHVSVPREELDSLYEKACDCYGSGHEISRMLAAILSRATPSDVCDFCGGDCSAANPPVATCPLITQGVDAAIDTVRKVDEATPSAPRVVTDEDVERAWVVFDGQRFTDRLSDESMRRMRSTLESWLQGKS